MATASATLPSTPRRNTAAASGFLYDADRNLSIPYELINDSNSATKMSFTKCCQFSQQYIFGRCVFLIDSRDGFLNASNFSTYNGKRLQRYSLTNSYRSFKIHGFTHRVLRGDLCRRYKPCENNSSIEILDISDFGKFISKQSSKFIVDKKTEKSLVNDNQLQSPLSLLNRLSNMTVNRLERNCIINRSKYYHPFLFLHFVQTEYNYAIFNDSFDFIYRYVEENDYSISLGELNVPRLRSITHSRDTNGIILSVDCNETKLKFFRAQISHVENCESYVNYLRTDPLCDWISVTHYDDNRTSLFQLYENESFYAEVIMVHGSGRYKFVHDNETYVRCVTFLHYLLWRKNYEDYLNVIPHLLSNFDRQRVARIIPRQGALDDRINRILVAEKSSSVFRCSIQLGDASLGKANRSRKKRFDARKKSPTTLKKRRYGKRLCERESEKTGTTHENNRNYAAECGCEIMNDKKNQTKNLNNYNIAEQTNAIAGITHASSSLQSDSQEHEPHSRGPALYFCSNDAETRHDDTPYRWYLYENINRGTTTTQTSFSKVLEEYCLFDSDFAAAQLYNDHHARDQEIRALEKEIANLKRELSTQTQDVFSLTQSMIYPSLTCDIMDFPSPSTVVPSVSSASSLTPDNHTAVTYHEL